jgi:hypothetical protein
MGLATSKSLQRWVFMLMCCRVGGNGAEPRALMGSGTGNVRVVLGSMTPRWTPVSKLWRVSRRRLTGRRGRAGRLPISPRKPSKKGSVRVGRHRRCAAGWAPIRSSRVSSGRGSSPETRTSPSRPELDLYERRREGRSSPIGRCSSDVRSARWQVWLPGPRGPSPGVRGPHEVVPAFAQIP